tara:strand:- start:247 stop:510 length:264 start_codon:yes stop_codon:yes gene_type:complete
MAAGMLSIVLSKLFGALANFAAGVFEKYKWEGAIRDSVVSRVESWQEYQARRAMGYRARRAADPGASHGWRVRKRGGGFRGGPRSGG